MIKVYFLEIERDLTTNTERVRGMNYIHNAIVECTEKPDIRKLIMDTTPEEDIALSALAIEVRAPTAQESLSFNSLPLFTLTRNLEKEIDDLKALSVVFDARLAKDIGGHVR